MYYMCVSSKKKKLHLWGITITAKKEKGKKKKMEYPI